MNLRCEPATDFQHYTRGGSRDSQLSAKDVFERESWKTGVKRSMLRHPPQGVYAGFKDKSLKRVNDQISNLTQTIETNIRAFAGSASLKLLNTLDLDSEEITPNQERIIRQSLLQDLRHRIYDSPMCNYFLAVSLPENVRAEKRKLDDPTACDRTLKAIKIARKHIAEQGLELETHDKLDTAENSASEPAEDSVSFAVPDAEATEAMLGFDDAATASVPVQKANESMLGVDDAATASVPVQKANEAMLGVDDAATASVPVEHAMKMEIDDDGETAVDYEEGDYLGSNTFTSDTENIDQQADNQDDPSTDDGSQASLVARIEAEEKHFAEEFINDEVFSVSTRADSEASQESFVFEPRAVKQEHVAPTEQVPEQEPEQEPTDDNINWNELTADELLPFELLQRIRSIFMSGPISESGRSQMCHWIKQMLALRLVEQDVISWSEDGGSIVNRCPMPVNLARINAIKAQRAQGVNPIIVRRDGIHLRPKNCAKWNDGLFSALLIPEELHSEAQTDERIREDDANDCIIVSVTRGNRERQVVKPDPEKCPQASPSSTAPVPPQSTQGELHTEGMLPHSSATDATDLSSSTRVNTRHVEMVPLGSDCLVSAPDVALLIPLFIDSAIELGIDVPQDEELVSKILKLVLEKKNVQINLPKPKQKKVQWEAFRIARKLKLQRIEERKAAMDCDYSEPESAENPNQPKDQDKSAEIESGDQSFEIQPRGLALPNRCWPLEDGWINPKTYLRTQAGGPSRKRPLSPPLTRHV